MWYDDYIPIQLAYIFAISDRSAFAQIATSLPTGAQSTLLETVLLLNLTLTAAGQLDGDIPQG